MQLLYQFAQSILLGEMGSNERSWESGEEVFIVPDVIEAQANIAIAPDVSTAESSHDTHATLPRSQVSNDYELPTTVDVTSQDCEPSTTEQADMETSSDNPQPLSIANLKAAEKDSNKDEQGKAAANQDTDTASEAGKSDVSSISFAQSVNSDDLFGQNFEPSSSSSAHNNINDTPFKEETETDAEGSNSASSGPQFLDFKDAVGRKFKFPWSVVKKWKGMEQLIKQAFLHVDVIGSHVYDGHYDLMSQDGHSKCLFLHYCSSYHHVIFPLHSLVKSPALTDFPKTLSLTNAL
jgi:hypothetical protein